MSSSGQTMEGDVAESVGADEDAADDLVSDLIRLRPEMYARALFLTQGQAAAADLVQDVLERALIARNQFQRGTNLRAWLFSIMRNRFIDEYRRGTFTVARDVKETATKDDCCFGPLDVLSMNDVLDAMAMLGRAEREIFTLAYLDHLPHRTISERLGIPLNTTGTRLFRVRAKLRRLLTRVYQDRATELERTRELR